MQQFFNMFSLELLYNIIYLWSATVIKIPIQYNIFEAYYRN